MAPEDVVNYLEPTQPNPGYNEGFGVRFVRPRGVKDVANKILNGCINEVGNSFYE